MIFKSRTTRGIALSAIAALTLGAGTASALSTTVTVDGILQAGEYLAGTEGTDHGTINLPWYNDHESIHFDPNTQSNDLHWEISGTESTDGIMLNAFFEVPGFARRMIWQDDCNYEFGDTLADAKCTPLATALIGDGLSEDQVYAALNSYENNHHGHANMSHETQTKSELFELQTIDSGTIFQVQWDRSDLNTGDNYVTHKTSYDWVLANGCTTAFCDAWDKTASVEVKWGFDSANEAKSFLSTIGKMRLHLSDEARGLPVLFNTPCEPGQCGDDDPTPVPLPASLPLLLAGIGGFGVMARRKRKAA